MKDKQEVKRQHKMVIGSVLLVMSGVGFGIFGVLGYLIQLDKSAVWIPLVSILFLIVGMGVLLYRDDQLQEEYTKEK